MTVMSFARSFLKLFLGIVLFFVALMALYLMWLWWDMRQLRAFCDDVRPGMPVRELVQVADRHGIQTHWLKGEGAADKENGLWYFYVPSTASVGSNVCAISHNRETVVSATVKID